MRRVVVTGMGAITPVGNDVETMWANMLAGVNGVEKITAFDTSDLKVHLAGTVKNFEPEKYIEKRELRKLDIYCQYAIAAAQQAGRADRCSGNTCTLQECTAGNLVRHKACLLNQWQKSFSSLIRL